MNAGWKEIPLGKLCKVQSGSSNTQDAVSDGAYMFFDRSKTPKRSGQYLFDCEALIVAGEGAEFRPKRFNGKFDLHQRAYAIHGFGNHLLGDYLFYYLEYVHEYFQSVAVGATVKSLRQRHFDNLPVIVAPVEEQRRIVAVLDEAFAAIDTAIANAEKNLANARDLFEACVRETFASADQSWALLTLKEAAIDFGRGKSKHRPRNDPKLYGGEYPFIQTGDVRNCDHLITEYSQTYSAAGLAQSKLWPNGTICITIAANIAETGILNFDACFPDSVIGMVVDPARTSNSYVEYLLQSLKAVLQSKGKGSAQANINLATFENERFPFPPKDVQMAIVARLGALSQQVQAMEALYADRLISLDALKQSILHRTFTGELTAAMPGSIAA